MLVEKEIFLYVHYFVLHKKYITHEFSEDMHGSWEVKLSSIEKDGQKKGEDIVITFLRVEEETSRKPQSVLLSIKFIQ